MRTAIYTTSCFFGFVVVYWLHDFLLIDSCLDMGGSFDKATSVCTSGHTYEELYQVVTWQLFFFYLLVGFIVTLFCGFILSKALLFLRAKSNEN
jgi:hypothetical protein